MSFDFNDLSAIGELVRKARGSHSQAWLAKKIGTKASAISNIENGKRSVPRDKVELLASILRIEANSLIPKTRVVNEIKHLSFSFRGVETLPREALEELQEHYLKLKNKHKIDADVTNKTPEDIASEVISDYKIHKPPINLEFVCNKLKANITFTDNIDFSGYIFHDSKKGFSGIGVKADMSQGRRRFTIAHEIGHLLLDHLIPGQKLECSEVGLSKSNREREADVFASNLLMPKEWVRQVLDNEKCSIESVNRIADIFQVSRTAAAIRMVEVSGKRCAVVMSEGDRIKWGVASSNLGGWIKRGTKLAKNSQAFKLLKAPLKIRKAPVRTKTEYWFETSIKGRFTESSGLLYQDSILTLIWEC